MWRRNYRCWRFYRSRPQGPQGESLAIVNCELNRGDRFGLVAQLFTVRTGCAARLLAHRIAFAIPSRIGNNLAEGTFSFLVAASRRGVARWQIGTADWQPWRPSSRERYLWGRRLAGTTSAAAARTGGMAPPGELFFPSVVINSAVNIMNPEPQLADNQVPIRRPRADPRSTSRQSAAPCHPSTQPLDLNTSGR